MLAKEKKAIMKNGLTRTPQLELFGDHEGDNNEEMSNSMDIWDSIPKFFLSHKKQASLRGADGKADPYIRDFSIKGATYTVELFPALIQQKEGNHIACFPGPSEELVEEAYKKLAAHKLNGFNQLENREMSTWVLFYYRELQIILKDMGHERNIAQIKTSLEILRLSQLKIKPKSKGNGVIRSYFASILPEAILTSRDDYIDNADSRNAIKLPKLVTDAVIKGEYRQINYKLYGKLKMGLSRWIYRRLVHTWKGAKPPARININKQGTFYDINLKELEASSGYLEHPLLAHKRQHLVRALKDLVENDIINDFEQIEVIKDDSGRTSNYIFRITPTHTFKQLQINANVRDKKLTGKLNSLPSAYSAT